MEERIAKLETRVAALEQLLAVYEHSTCDPHKLSRDDVDAIVYILKLFGAKIDPHEHDIMKTLTQIKTQLPDKQCIPMMASAHRRFGYDIAKVINQAFGTKLDGSPDMIFRDVCQLIQDTHDVGCIHTTAPLGTSGCADNIVRILNGLADVAMWLMRDTEVLACTTAGCAL